MAEPKFKPKPNSTTLDTINDDCLQQIIEYLNIVDSVSLAATCKRMANFFETDVFPRKANQIAIKNPTIYHIIAFVMSPLDPYPSQFTHESLITLFSHIGEFVKNLKIIDTMAWNYCVIGMNYCNNLTKLSISGDEVRPSQAYQLQRLINKSQNLEELVLNVKNGITNNWRTSNCFPKVSKLTFLAKNKINSYFTDCFRNLSSLTIDFIMYAMVEPNDLATILDNNSHCLKSLKLLNLFPLIGRDRECFGLAKIISDKVPNMESLALGFILGKNTMSLINLPHLKALNIYCGEKSVNAVLRTLSDNGRIERLTIIKGVFDDDDPIGPPLIFHNLQMFCLSPGQNTSSLLNLLTRSEMPTLHCLIIMDSIDCKVLNNELLRFIESKNTLKLIRLDLIYRQIFPIEFLLQIIRISRTTFRRTLKFQFSKDQLRADALNLLAANRHLIKFQVVTDRMRPKI